MSRSIVIALFLLTACRGADAPPPEDLAADAAIQTDSAVASPDELGVPDAAAEASPAPAPPPPAARRPAQPAQADRPAEPAPVEEPARQEPPAEPAPLVVSSGTEFAVAIGSEITSRRNHAGDRLMTRVVADVADVTGAVAIPANAGVWIEILEIKPAENRGGQGSLTIRPVEVVIDDASYPIRADVTALSTETRGRGVTGGDAAKVGAGAAAGALLGQILGKKTSSTVIGGVVGAAVGTAIAIQTADRDIVLPEGSRLTLRVSSDFARPAPR